MTFTPFETHPHYYARRDLVKAMVDLPFVTTTLGDGPFSNAELNTLSEEEFAAKLTSWVQVYAVLVRVARDTHTDMEAELHQLRSQREAVRSFFGTTGRAQ